MSRISRVAITIIVGLIISVGALVKLGGPAVAQSAPSRSAGLTDHATATHATAAPATPPPLPFGSQRATSASAVGGSGKPIILPFTLRPVPALPARFASRAPKLSQVLKELKSGRRHISSATGATIVLTGDANFLEINDQTLPYGANVFYLCQNLKPSTSYSYVIFPPNNGRLTGAGTGEQPKTAAFTTNAQGQCDTAANGGGGQDYEGNILLQTPFNQGGAVDPPYPSVWTVAMLNNTTNQFETVAFTVVLATLHFNTFVDAGFTTLGKDYTPGSTVFMQATGLTPSHEYAFGVVNTSIAPLSCVFTQPAAAQNFAGGATCFNDGVVTGVIPTNGTFSGSWSIPANESTGTYAVELYDVTSQDLVSTQQISIAPAANAITLTPLNGATAGTNLGDTFATDGFLSVNGALTAEQSVTGFSFSVAGITANDTYAMTLSTPNGVVLTNSPAGGGAVANPSVNNQTLAPPLTVKPATTSITNQAFQFPIDTRAPTTTVTAAGGTFAGVGPTFTSFAANVMTLQLFDQTKGVVAASKAFYVVAYQAQFQWTSPAGTTVTVAATGTNVQATVTNSAGTAYGSWNGDGIKSIVFAPDTGNNITLALDGATATDSTGQTWNIAKIGTTIVATPATAGQFLANNATLVVPLNVSVPAAKCQTAVCTLQTAITPVHGIAQSGFDVATNGLGVFGPGAIPANGSSTYQWQVTAGPGGALGAGAPRYTQLMYVSGTDGVTTGNYTVKLNVVNCGTSTENIMEFEMTLPPSFDANTASQAPTLSTATVGGANQNADWVLCTAASGNANCTGTNRVAVLHQNQFAIVCTPNDKNKNGCGIPFTSAAGCTSAALTTASTGTFTLSWPMPALDFPLQEISMTADYQGGCENGNAACAVANQDAPFQVNPIQQLTNAVNGPANVDSTELGVYSLNSTLMTGVMNPSTVGQGVAVTSQFQFTNTATSAGVPNPDSVDEITLTLPTADAPNSITPPANWFLNSQTTAAPNTTYTFSVCNGGPPPCGISAPTFPGGDEPNALPPGGSANFTFNYTAAPFPAAGTATITWTAFGANGGAAAVSQTTTLLFANTIASLAFIDAGGGVDGLPQIPVVGGQPTIGSDAEDLDTLGNQFVLRLTNNGTQTITGTTIGVPALDTNGDAMQDTTHDWQISNVTTAGGGCGAPTVTLPKEATNTRGSIVLAGCSLAPGASMTITFDSQVPYDLTPTRIYSFGTGSTVTSAVTANAAITSTAGNPQSDTMLVVSDAQLDIFIPTASNSIPNGNGGTFTNGSCAGCTFTQAGAAVGTTPGSLAIIDLGTFAGTFTGNDLVNAAVTSDTEAGHGWTLFVSNSAQTSGTVSGTVFGELDGTDVTANPAFTKTLSTAAFTQLATTNPGTQVSSFAGQTQANAFAHAAVPNVMNFQITLPAFPAAQTPGTQTVTLLYTLIPN
jgi:hypothetical protein